MVVVASVRLDYSSTTVGTTNWVQLSPVDGQGAAISSKQLPAEISQMEIADTGGNVMELGVGDGQASTTYRIALIGRGGSDGPEKTVISKGSLIWVRAINASTSTGDLVINFGHGRK